MNCPDERQLLVVVFDVNPVWWGLKSLQGQSQITKCLDCLLVFINSFLMLRHDNLLAVIASHSTKRYFLFDYLLKCKKKKFIFSMLVLQNTLKPNFKLFF